MDRLFWVAEDWTVENGFLTPTLKIKRNRVEAHYRDAVYAAADSAKKVVFLDA